MKETMKANVYFGLGDARLIDVPTPKIENDDDAIIRVDLSTICASDIELVYAEPIHPLATKGNTIGHEYVGTVVEVGKNVKGFKAGDRIVGNATFGCGECENCRNGQLGLCTDIGAQKYPGFLIPGCQAEYIKVPKADVNLHAIPEHITNEQALFVGDILTTGYSTAEAAHIKEGDTVVLYGCGPVGICALTCARLFKPGKIIAIDGLQERLDIALEHGVCDYAINFREANVPEEIAKLTEGKLADIVLLCGGPASLAKEAMSIIHPNGTVVSAIVSTEELCVDYFDFVCNSKKLVGILCNLSFAEKVLSYVADGTIDVSYLITHSSPLNDIAKAYDIFKNKKDGCIKYVITPYEE